MAKVKAVTIYGIKNCDTMKKARAWLDARAGTTFRKLPESDKNGLTERKAVALMLDQPSMIKRPVLDVAGELFVGFKLGAVRTGARPTVAGFIGAYAPVRRRSNALMAPAALDRAACGEPMRCLWTMLPRRTIT